MTAQLSRIVYRIGSPESDQHHFTDSKDYADIAKNNGYEVAKYVLAGMDSEPLAYFYPGDETEWQGVALAEELDDEHKARCIPLYAAPPAPVAVPDVLERLRSIVADPRALPRRKEWISGQRYSYVLLEEVEAIVDNACRAAMLKAGPVTGWIKCSERIPEEGGRYWCYVEEQNSLGKSHYQWNCSWNGDGWSDKALTGRVTHWMPLPAAPEQEV